MDRRLPQTIGLAALTALLTIFVAQVDGAPVVREAAGRIAADSGARDSAVTIKWLNDANVLALVGVMNGRQIAASQIEAAGAHSDSVRALAVSLAKEYAESQRSADSLAGMLHIAAVPSALNSQVYAEFQKQIDSTMMGKGGAELDRAYLDEQVASHKLMGSYLDQLSGVAQAPELQAWIGAADGRVASQITRIQGRQRALVVADSVVADSLARRAAARRKR